jgi:hypothetical protein
MLLLTMAGIQKKYGGHEGGSRYAHIQLRYERRHLICKGAVLSALTGKYRVVGAQLISNYKVGGSRTNLKLKYSVL